MTGGKKLRLRWAATCADCGEALAPGDQAWWFHLDDVGRCVRCVEGPAPAPRAADAPVAASEEPAPIKSRPPTPPERSAGGSAQAEYDRRRSNDRAWIRQNLGRLVVVVVAAPFVGYFGVRLGAAVLDGQFRSLASSATDGADPGPMFDSSLVHLVGLCAAFALTVTAARFAFGARQTTEAWRTGAEGERLTARALQKLPASYRVLHDLPIHAPRPTSITSSSDPPACSPSRRRTTRTASR